MKEAAVKKILLSFRQTDSAATYERITERLIAYFGSDALLRIAHESLGGDTADSDYRAALEQAMAECGLVVLVIGPDWLKTGAGERYLDDPNDTARIEIEAALRRGIPVVPTLVQGAAMPAPEDLPPTVRLLIEQGQQGGREGSSEALLGLICRTGLPVRQDPDFQGDTMRLCEIIESLTKLTPDDPKRATRRLRDTMLTTIAIFTAALAIHGVALAVSADRWLLTTATGSQAQALVTRFWLLNAWAPLLDIAVLVLAAYIVARRTGDMQAGVMTAMATELGAANIGAVALGIVTWANWPLILSAARSGPLPDMGAYVLALALAASGIPIGVGASILLGLIGGGAGQSTYNNRKRRQWKLRHDSLVGSALPVSTRQGATAPGTVFLSYRRDDSAIMCGSIYERLVDIFDIQSVFKDIDMIPIGANFQTYIDAALEQSRVQLVIIGPHWLDIRSADGRRRLDDPGDFVRLEVESALRLGLTVIPVLVQGATLPGAADLPESLRPLLNHDPLKVRAAPDFDADMRALASDMWPAMQAPDATQDESARQQAHRQPRVTNVSTWRSTIIRLAIFALYGVGFGAIVERLLGRVLPPLLRGRPPVSVGPTDIIPIVGAVLALFALSAAMNMAHARHSRRVGGAIGWSLLGIVVAIGTATAIVLIFGGELVQRLKSAELQSFIPQVLFLAIVLLVLVIVLLLPILAITSWIGTYLPRGRWLPSRKSLIVAGASGNDDALQALVGLRAEFGGRVVPIAKLLASSEGAPHDALERAMRRCVAVVALLEPDWGQVDHREEQPLNQAVESAMAARKPIIPVLLTGASMPSLDQLSSAGRALAMLNAAFVRRTPDFAVDMRRLNSVIARVTGLRPAWRMTGGVILSLLATLLAIAVTAAGGLYFDISDVISIAHNGTTTFGVLAVTTALGWFVYPLVGLFATAWTGRQRDAILAALVSGLFGNGIAVGYLGALTAQNGAPLAHLTSANSQILQVDLVLLGTFLVVSGLIVSVLFGWIGAYIGHMIYRERERRIQNRILYRALLTGTVTNQAQAETPSEAASLDSSSNAAISEASRRAEIAADMERAYRQARLRRTRRNGVALGAALILAIAAVVLGSQVYAGETNARQQQSTSIEHQQTATTVAAATQKAVQGTATAKAERTASARSTASAIAGALIPFTAHVPGPCGGAVEWYVAEASSTTCTSDGFTLREAAGQKYFSDVTFSWSSHGFTSHYTVAVAVSSLLTSTCAGLLTNIQASTSGSIGYQICHDGTWRIIRYDNATGNPIVLVTHAASLASTNRLQVTVNGPRIQFMLNGATIWTLTNNPYTTTDSVGIYVDAYNRAAVAATFSDFKCALLP